MEVTINDKISTSAINSNGITLKITFGEENQDYKRKNNSTKNRSYPRRREYFKSKHDYTRYETECTNRFKEYSYERRERRERDFSREQNLRHSLQYFQQVPFPVYYGGIPPPMCQPYFTSFIDPQEIYGFALPHDPGYGSIY